jgi:monofunctional biosynthetic peptidoglycan transglycosylase
MRDAKIKKAIRGKKRPKKPSLMKRLRRLIWRGALGAVVMVLALTFAFSVINPPTNIYMASESRRLGGVEQTWVSLDRIAPVMVRSAVAAEDANFCLHWGLDVDAIQSAIDEGSSRGASTISQQTVKNVYLWHGRSYVRKALEALWTPLVEAVWSKERILEVYLNVAEFDEGVFGVQAASRHYFGRDAADLTATQAARLAMVLPSPKTRSASDPTSAQRRRTASIMDGAATIRADGRARCFQG